jgi:hypothetical protein
VVSERDRLTARSIPDSHADSEKICAFDRVKRTYLPPHGHVNQRSQRLAVVGL